MGLDLKAVRVEAIERDIVNARIEPRLDQPRDSVKLLTEVGLRIVVGAPVAGNRLANAATRIERGSCRIADVRDEIVGLAGGRLDEPFSQSGELGRSVGVELKLVKGTDRRNLYL